MGVDLDLLPFDSDIEGLAFSHTVLTCERRRELWSAIEQLEQHTVPAKFTTYRGRLDDGETGYGVTDETAYGTALTYVNAEQLKKLWNHPAVTDNYKNRAIWAYLRELPDKAKIALYWH